MASGDTFLSLPAHAGWPPAADYARFSKSTTTLTPLLLFDDTTTETIFFTCYMPGQYDGSTDINVVLGWNFLTYVGAQTCKWDVSFGRIADDADSIDSVVFAASQTLTPVEPSATGEVDYATISFTNVQADGIQPNELFILRVQRDAAGGTASPGDSRLIFCSIKEV